MKRGTLLWLAIAAVLAVIVAVQVVLTEGARSRALAAQTVGAPEVVPGVDIVAGIPLLPLRVRGFDYRRAAFGNAWDDDNSAPGGHNGCDTRNDILDRDLIEKSYTAIKRCPDAVASGTLHDPYTNAIVAFVRGNQVGASVQIDHIVPLAYAWDMGARDWTDERRKRFANDPANLLAVAGGANQQKGDKEPGIWMPPNSAFWCQYAVQFAEVLRGYGLSTDQPSADRLRSAAATCPVAVNPG